MATRRVPPQTELVGARGSEDEEGVVVTSCHIDEPRSSDDSKKYCPLTNPAPNCRCRKIA